MAKISVVVPVYNAEKYISNTVCSILSQENCDIELILVNDGSKDDSESLCRKLAENDERIVFITGENFGPGHARNVGIGRASGEYIAFCDSDDILQKDMYKSLLCELENNDADLSVCDIYSERDGKNMGFPFENEAFFGKEELGKYVASMIGNLSDNDKTPIFWGSSVRCLYRADILKKNSVLFPEDIFFAEDLVFNLRYLKNCNRVAICRKALYFYTCNGESLMLSHSRYRDGMFEERKKLTKYLLESICDFENADDLNKRLTTTSRLYFYECIGNACRKAEDRTFFDSYRDVKKILRDKDVSSVFASFDARGRYGYLYLAIKHKMALLLCLYYKLRFI